MWVGVLPIYIGIVFLSISIDWAFADSFSGILPGFYTLFSLQAGDAVFDTFTSAKNANYFYGHLFGWFYVFFAVAIVQNTFFIIVEDAYISIKYAKNFEWLNTGYNPGLE